MDGGASNVNPPNSHSSNPIHKAADAESAPSDPEYGVEPRVEQPPPAGYGDRGGAPSHDLNKIIVFLGAVAFAGIIFYALR